jgi:RNAse (barnase) inhibitor barstar
MSTFKDDAQEFQRLDYSILQNGAISLYYRAKVLNSDIEWLKNHGYQTNNFDCSLWHNERKMHEILASELDFPGYYGRNLDAFNDCLSDIEITTDGGRVLIFQNYDFFTNLYPKIAWLLLDIIELNSRRSLLFGKRLFALVQSNDPRILFEPVGARPVLWNSKEWSDRNRGL